jgi:hypothetical protein
MTEQQKDVEQKVQESRDYRNSDCKYAILQETSGEENETWINFIKYQGNEDALAHLENQLKQIEFYIIDDLSTFDLETDYLVSELTAKEMTKVDLNHFSFHRKFDGKLKHIDLGLKQHYTNEKKIKKTFSVLGYGKIEDYIDQEDIDPEDLNNASSESETESETETESSTSVSSSNSQTEKKEDKKQGNIPKILSCKKTQEMPRFAKAKAHRKHKK